MNFLINVCTNQFFLMFLAIWIGLLIGKIKIKSFSLGVSGGIFSGIAIGYIATRWAKSVNTEEVGVAATNAKRILSNGVVAQVFFVFFLMLFLVAIGLKVGGSMGVILKKYGAKLVFIGVSIPVISMLVSCALFGTVFSNNKAVSEFEVIGMYAGAMTTTPGYGTALDAAGRVDYETVYKNATNEEKTVILSKIDSSEELKAEDIDSLSAEQVTMYKEAAASAISLGYTVAFPMGVLVIVIILSVLPKLLRIDTNKEIERYKAEISTVSTGQDIEPVAINFGIIGLVAALGLILGNIEVPLGTLGKFSLGGSGGILVMALILSYIGKIGPVNFRMDQKSLGMLYQMGLVFFMSIVGLRYGYDVVNALMGSGLSLALGAVAVESIAVIIVVFIGRKVFKLNWIILSGAIAGGCTSAPGLGAAIATTGSEDATVGYGAAQPFAILANVLLATIYFGIVF